MYKKPQYEETRIDLDNKKPGETIENKVTRLIQNKEPIKDGAPIIFTDRSHGVNPAYNIRTDRWEIATEAMDRITRKKLAERENVAKGPETEAKVVKGDFGEAKNTVASGE